MEVEIIPIQPVTIEDVARLAGVSRATAGRVIGNYGSASEKSKEKVLKAAKELNFTPNINAQGLRGHTTKTIAVVVGNIKNNYCNALVYTIEKAAIKQGFNVLICNTNEKTNKEIQQLLTLKSRNVDGIILMTTVKNNKGISDHLKYLYDGDTPIVLVDRKIKNLVKDFVGSKDFESAYNATNYLLSLEHKVIGVVGTGNFFTNQHRIEGYRQALRDHGIKCSSKLVIQTEYEEENAGRNACRELLARNKSITAVLILNNTLCGDIYLELMQNKVKIPQDLSIITWDDEQLNELLGITTVSQAVEEIGQRAVNRMFELLEPSEQSKEYQVEELDTTLIVRESCAPPRING